MMIHCTKNNFTPKKKKPFYLSAILIFAALFSQVSTFAAIYQAETADLYKAVSETKNSGFTGESYINFDNEPGSFLEIRVGMTLAGQQPVQIRYANGTATSRPMSVFLNDTLLFESLVFESTGSWTNWDTLEILAPFNSGISRIRFTSTGNEGGPNIDQFEISGEQLPYYNLNLSVNGNGEIIRIPENGLLFKGQEITLIARPGYNSVFKEWTDDFTGNRDTLKFNLEGEITLGARFIEIEIYLPEPDFSMIGYATIPGEGIETTTGGENGKITVIEHLAQLISWGAGREDNYTPETLIIKGKIEAEETTVISIKRGKDISILGDSESNGGFAELKNISLNIRDYSNVIVRNLKMHEVFYPDDDLTIDNCHHVWIDHCEFHSKTGPGITVDTYDGLLDIKKGSRNVTVSWCWFHDHMKTVLIGHSDNNGEQDVNLEVTFHHNLFSNTDGRNPSLRFGKVHFFNNYLENITDYGFAVRNGAHAKIENCHFHNVNTPVATDKFTGHGFACVSGCIYSGTFSETDNQISEPLDCDFWSDKIRYVYSPESTNTVKISTGAFAGVGKIITVTTIQENAKAKNLQLNRIYFDSQEESIRLNFSTLKNQKLKVSVYTAGGKIVLMDSRLFSQGNHTMNLRLNQFVRGIYFIKLESPTERFTGKIVL